MALEARQLRVKLGTGADHFGDALCSGVRLTVYQCCSCGTVFGLTDNFVKNRQGDHKNFFCPWCQGSLIFNGSSEEEKLKKQLEQERQRSGRLASQLDQTAASLRATRGVVTKVKRQRDRMHDMVVAGQCPVPGCRRHFKNLAAHMERQHPGFTQE